MAAEIIWISSSTCRTKATIDFSPVPWQRSLAKVNPMDPRRLATQDGWGVNDGFNNGDRRFFSPASKFIAKRRSRPGHVIYLGEVPLTVITASIYRVPMPVWSWDREIGIRKRKLSVMVSMGSFCYIRRSPGPRIFQSTLIECMIGWESRAPYKAGR